MSLDADAIVDRRRLRRKLTFWRVVAVLVAIFAVVLAGTALRGRSGLGLGEPGLYATLRRFGFGEPAGLPLPGEAAGVLRPRGRAWFDVETANASFGQGISVTTMQLAMAMGAIANGG